jgi:hypothetical protein
VERVVTRAQTAASKIYGALLFLYPPAFRREFAPQMARDFEEATHEAWDADRWRALLPLWLLVATDLTRTIVAQWVRSGLPALALLSPIPAFAAFSFAAARIKHVRPFVIATPPADREVLALLLAATVVILLLAAAITITLLFTRPLLYRRR